MSWSDRFARWIVRHKRAYRVTWVGFMLFMTYLSIRGGVEYGWNFLRITSVTISFAIIGAVVAMWLRTDVLWEFEDRCRKEIGSDANLVILAVRLQLQTRSIRKLNLIMREYDVMGTPKLDLPPEAKELREIFESVQTK